MKHFFYISVLFLLTGCFGNQGLPVKNTSEDPIEDAASNLLDHSGWDTLLVGFVDEEGFVDYKGFQNKQAELDQYLDYLSNNEPQNEWPIEEQMAYYINLYNAATISLVVKNYPVESIQDIKSKGPIKKPWVIKFIKIGKKTFTLHGLESGILREMGDARIHFAINCASYSCPKLQNRAYTAMNLNTMLNKASSEFFNSDRNILDAQIPKLSAIMDWYRSDYEDEGVSLIEYVNRYGNIRIEEGAKVEFLEYDWSLNER